MLQRASTPDWIIKEVIEQMEEYKMDVQEENMEESSKQNNVATEEAVLPQTEETTPNSIDLGEQINIQTFRPGDLITGTIVQVASDEALIDIGGKSEGILPVTEFSNTKVDLCDV